MNFRRLVSAVAALAVAGTMCAGLAVTASAATEVTASWDFTSSGMTAGTYMTYSSSTVTIGGTGCNLGTGEFDGLAAQGADKWYTLYGIGLYNSNGGGRTFGVLNLTKGQIVTIAASTSLTLTSSNASVSSSSNTYTYTMSSDGNLGVSMARYNYIYSITVETPVVSSDTYSITAEDTDSATVAVLAQSDAGETVTVTPTGKTGYSSPYTVTVTDANNNAVTVTENEDGTFSFTMPTSDVTVSAEATALTPADAVIKVVDGDGTVLKTYTTSSYESYTETIYYNKYIESNGIYYMTGSDYPYYKSVDAGSTVTITAEATDVAYAAEIEDLTPSRSYAASGTTTDRYSNGSAKRLYANSYVTLDGWTADSDIKATVALWSRNQSSSTEASISIYTLLNGELTDTGVDIGTWTTSLCDELEATVTVPAGAQIVLYNDTAYNSNLEMDYVAITLAPSITATTVTDTTVGTITVADTVYNASGNAVKSSEIDGIESVQTVYIKVDNEKPSVNPTVTLKNDDEDEATASQDSWYTRVGNSYYFIYQFVNVDSSYIAGADVICGDLSTTIATE